MSATVDLTGRRYGLLTVIGKLGRDNNRYITWDCLCDCGGRRLVTAANLNRGHAKSCGCRWKYKFGMSSQRALYKNYKSDAKDRKYSFNLTIDDFIELTSGNCNYCGTPPKQVFNMKQLNGYYVYNGIDRVDNTIGYEIGNCVPCCKRCNQAKNNMGLDEFKVWIDSVYNVMKTGGF